MGDYEKVLLDIANNLVADDIENIKFVLKGRGIGGAFLESVKTGLDVIKLLQKQCNLTQNNLSYLQEVLESSGCRDLASKLQGQLAVLKQWKAGSPYKQMLFVVSYYQETHNAVDLVQKMESHRMSILIGPAGSGKSQLSYWYAKRYEDKDQKNVVWKFQCSSLAYMSRSMKTLLDYLDIECIEIGQDKHTYVELMGKLIHGSLSDTSSDANHLLIFDDIHRSCLQVIQRVISSLRKVENLNIILTTNNAHICEQIHDTEDCCIQMNGMSDEEAVAFIKKSKYFKEAKEEDIKLLSKKLGHLPLGLFTARSYIQRTHTSIKKYIEYLEDDEFLKNLDSVPNTGSDHDYNKGLMNSQLVVLKELETIISPVAYIFFHFVPFLDYENIPVSILYNLLPSHLSDAAKDVQVGAFISGLEEYSLGEVRGIDDERIIAFHATTNLAMSLLPDFRLNRRKNISKLLHILASHIDMDGRQSSRLKSNLFLLEHASKVLQKMEKHVEEKTDEESVLTSYLYCTLGVTYRLDGCDDFMAQEFLNKAMHTCLKLGGEDDQFLQRIAVQWYPDENDEITEDVKRLYHALIEKGVSIPVEFYQQFVEEKIRSERDIQQLMWRGQLQMDDFPDNKISPSCHEKLIAKNLSMPNKELQKFFLIELMMSISYNMGRNLYRTKHSHYKSGTETLNDCHRFFGLSCQLSILMKRNCKGFLPVQSLIAERNGYLYLMIRVEDFGHSPSAPLQSLKKAVQRYSAMLEEDLDYFEFGVLKKGPGYNEHHVGMCYKLLLKCYSRWYEIAEDDCKEALHQKGLHYAQELEKLESKLENWIALAGFHVQIAKFYKLKPTSENLEKAINHLKTAIYLENREQDGALSHFMLQAKFNLIDCYLKIKSLKLAGKDCQELIHNLKHTNRELSLDKATKLLDEINKEINLDVHS